MKYFWLDVWLDFRAIFFPIVAVLLMWFVAIPLVLMATGMQHICNAIVAGVEWLANGLERMMERP